MTLQTRTLAEAQPSHSALPSERSAPSLGNRQCLDDATKDAPVAAELTFPISFVLDPFRDTILLNYLFKLPTFRPLCDNPRRR